MQAMGFFATTFFMGITRVRLMVSSGFAVRDMFCGTASAILFSGPVAHGLDPVRKQLCTSRTVVMNGFHICMSGGGAIMNVIQIFRGGI
jgi:hypothetical protein